MQSVFGFVEFYVVPLLFALGLVLFFRGFINYFLIGPGFEEERREIGRQSLLWAALLFLVGLIIFGIANWFVSLSGKIEERVDAEVESKPDVLLVPNTPIRPN